ncbi:MAG: hypothetical protein M9887_03050 [Chitinophagales bacterium]|nr:hypothetical protein [Chitinophagales bacterium]
MRILFIMLFAIIMASVESCKKENSNSDINSDWIDIAKEQLIQNFLSGDTVVNVSFTTKVAWTVLVREQGGEAERNARRSAGTSWISVNPAGGEAGLSNLTISLEPNTNDVMREAEIIIQSNDKSVVIKVAQEGGYEQTFTNPYLNPNLAYGSVTDIDGNVYATIKIGEQTWMAENLRTTRYNDGVAIPYITSGYDWEYLLNKGGYTLYDFLPENDAIYGKLYNWYAVNTGKLCPQGWRIPTVAMWDKLGNYLGSLGGNVGGRMKSTGTREAGTGLWSDPNGGATNESGFTGHPSGEISESPAFFGIGNYGRWWSATENTEVGGGLGEAYTRFLYYDGNPNSFNGGVSKKGTGLPCRCVQN